VGKEATKSQSAKEKLDVLYALKMATRRTVSILPVLADVRTLRKHFRRQGINEYEDIAIKS